MKLIFNLLSLIAAALTICAIVAMFIHKSLVCLIWITGGMLVAKGFREAAKEEAL